MTDRVIVVGAAGFLGGSLVRALRAEGRRVLGVSRRAAPTVDIALAGEEGLAVDLVSHLGVDDVVINAAGVAIKDAASEVALIRENLRIARAVGDACARVGARLLHVSSADIWPLADRAGAAEERKPLPDTSYGLSKLIAELDLSGMRGLACLCVRPTYVYGPGMFEGRVFGGVMRQAREGAVVMRGDPNSATDYLYIDDFVEAVRLLLGIKARAEWDGRVFHAASGVLLTLEEVARVLIEAVAADSGRPRASLRFETQTASPRQEGTVSVARMRSLGFAPRVTFAEGCTAYVRGGGQA